MFHGDPERVEKLRIAVRYLLAQEALERGPQSRLAEHFDVSRQRVHEVVNQERRRQLLRRRAAAPAPSN